MATPCKFTARNSTGRRILACVLSLLGALLELGKVRLSALATAAVVAGVGMGGASALSWRAVVGVATGSLLVAMAGAAFNMLIERERDARMRRTAGRPLPSGRLTPRVVATFAASAAVVGLATLWLSSNLLATGLCAAILFGYVLVYTPLKPRTPLSTLVGAVPGGLPPVVGYAAATGRLDTPALALFAILFMWQIPHFLAIAWRYREDYRAGGMQVLAVVDSSGRATSVRMVAYAVGLLLVSLWPWRLLMTGDCYPWLALGLGVAFLGPVCVAAVRRTDAAMRATFIASLVYLPLLYLAMYLDRA